MERTNIMVKFKTSRNIRETGLQDEGLDEHLQLDIRFWWRFVT